jgi:hypothetical protein
MEEVWRRGTVPRSSRGVNCEHSSFRTLKSAPLPDGGRQQRGKGLQHDTIHLAEDEGEVGRCAGVIACKPAHAVPPHVVHAVRQEEEGRVRRAVRRGSCCRRRVNQLDSRRAAYSVSSIL